MEKSSLASWQRSFYSTGLPHFGDMSALRNPHQGQVCLQLPRCPQSSHSIFIFMSQLSDSREINLKFVHLLESELGNKISEDWGIQKRAEAEINSKWIMDLNVKKKKKNYKILRKKKIGPNIHGSKSWVSQQFLRYGHQKCREQNFLKCWN